MKRGYFYFIEIILIILLVTLIWINFPVSQQSFTYLEDQQNLKEQGFQALRVLGETGVLETNSSNLSASVNAYNDVDYNNLRLDIRHSFPSTVDMRIEYIINTVNETICRSEFGQLKSNCGVNDTPRNIPVVTTQYTVTNQHYPYTIKLYLWRVFSGNER